MTGRTLQPGADADALMRALPRWVPPTKPDDLAGSDPVVSRGVASLERSPVVIPGVEHEQRRLGPSLEHPADPTSEPLERAAS